MPTFIGELSWREQNEEMASLRSIRGSSFLDKLRNNGLPTEWKITDAEGKDWKIEGSYIGSIRTIRLCAKSLEPTIDLSNVFNLTDSDAQKLFSYYPQWLYEKSGKAVVFKLLDDQALDEVTHATEVALRHMIMSNKFWCKLQTGRETFVYKDAYTLMGNILIENAVMTATSRATNSVVDTRIGAIFKNILDNEEISDSEIRSLLRTELQALQSKLHLELPEVYHEELDKWSKKVILERIKLLTDGSENEHE